MTTPLTNISSLAWEHPADQGALVALRKLKGFDWALKKVSGLLSERAVRMTLLGSSVRIDEHSFPRIWRLYQEVAKTLDVKDLPELYIGANPILNASTIGMERPMILLNSSIVSTLDDDELRFVLGHELGHVLSGHAIYHTMLRLLLSLSMVAMSLPLTLIGMRALVAGLMEWSRKSELSADRAGLLAVQDPQIALRTHMKLASGGAIDEIDQEAFLRQAAEYQSNDDARDVVLRALLVEGRSHPFAVVRAAELRRWIDSGDYESILAGAYPRRGREHETNLSDAAQKAASSYGDVFTTIDQTMTKLNDDIEGFVSELGAGAKSVAGWVSTLAKDLSNRKPR